MAGPARLALLHLLHGGRIRPPLRLEEVGMAVIATEHAGMGLMWKDDIAGILVDIEDISSVAGGAVAGHAECFLAVMADAAGLPLFHLVHGERRIFFGHDVIDLVMAGRAVLADGRHLHCEYSG